MAKPSLGNLGVVIRFGKRAGRMLLDFVNTMPEEAGFVRFRAKWERYGLMWDATEADFWQSQNMVRKTWEGKKKDIEGFQVALSLGLSGADGEEEVPPPPIHVDWKLGSLFVAPRNLLDLIWLTLLQHSQRLGVCENHIKGGGCLTPYFLRYRPTARFCSDACAVTAQRESKRRWWKEHGQEWLEETRRKKSTHGRRHGQ